MTAKRLSSNYGNDFRASAILDAPPRYTERNDDEDRAVEVCGPPPDPVFEPVERQRHFGILQYTVNNRFRNIMIIGIINVLLIVGLFLFIFLYVLRSNSSGPTSNSPNNQPTVTTKSYHPEVTYTTTASTWTTTNYNPPCTPNTKTTFLFAYSNDFDSQTVSNVWNHFADSRMESIYSTFANIRFDIKNEDEIQYNSDWRDVSASIQSHLPNPSLSFDSTSGSDVLKMMRKFMDNTQAPVCGSQMYILVKRYPSETEIEELVTILRENQASFTFMTSINPTGGNHPETLYNLATRTHGFCGFDDNISGAIGSLPGGLNSYLVYAVNPTVSEQGEINLMPFTVPNSGGYWFSVTIQDHGPIDYSAKVKLSWNNSQSKQSGFLGAPINSTGWLGNHLGAWVFNLDQVAYNMNLEYEYTYEKVQTLQIRIYSKEPVDDWASYDN